MRFTWMLIWKPGTTGEKAKCPAMEGIPVSQRNASGPEGGVPPHGGTNGAGTPGVIPKGANIAAPGPCTVIFPPVRKNDGMTDPGGRNILPVPITQPVMS